MPHEPRQPRRRQLLFAAAVLTTGLAPALGLPAARTPTPAQSRGPFYPDRLPLDRDNDLTRRMPEGNAAHGVARGEITDLAGRVLTTEGAPLEGAVVEIWQCDANGRYLHTGDRGGAPRDPGFQGYGRTRTDSDGGYRFRTIKPVPYPGRAPHIHIAVTAADGRQFVTQVYVEGAPENPDDFLRRRLPPAERAAVTMPFHPAADAPGLLAARFDIVLG